MQFSNSTTVTNMQEIDTAFLENISGGAGDQQGTGDEPINVPGIPLIPLPR